MRDTNGDLPNVPVDMREGAIGGHTRIPHARPYYEDLNVGHDWLMRCAECRQLVLHADMIANKGQTLCCGTRRVKEIRSLSFWEWLKVRIGMVDFPYRKEFLAEFAERRSKRHQEVRS